MKSEFSTSGFSDALVILGAAGIVIPAFARIRISPIIGFILIGMLVGPSGLGALTDTYPRLHYVTISNTHAIEPFEQSSGVGRPAHAIDPAQNLPAVVEPRHGQSQPHGLLHVAVARRHKGRCRFAESSGRLEVAKVFDGRHR